jgi:hypothetical protein
MVLDYGAVNDQAARESSIGQLAVTIRNTSNTALLRQDSKPDAATLTTIR